MPDLTGVNFGPYRILNLIGRGGMSTVYRAYQDGMDRLVALKVLHDHITPESEIVQRFKQEALVIARLEHRNIVPLYDSGDVQGTLYLTMRYMRAGTVKDIIARGVLPLSDAFRLLADVAAALDHAHALGIIHRDVKPNNVLVDDQGHAYLTDFGLAKVLGTATALTGTSVTLGTPTYMAPEQALSRPVTPQTDIYALGVMLYEMTVGQPPFSADTPMATAMKHVHEPLLPPRQVNPVVSEAAEAVIVRALAKEPTDRFASAGEMASALQQAVESELQMQRAYFATSLLVPRESLPELRSSELETLAGEIASTKGEEQVTHELRAELRRLDRAGNRKRLLVLARLILTALIIAGGAFSLLLALGPAGRVRADAAQTATAISLLLIKLNDAQTAIAGGGSGLEPTLQYLQTQLAVVPTTGTLTATPSPTNVALIPGLSQSPQPTNTRRGAPSPTDIYPPWDTDTPEPTEIPPDTDTPEPPVDTKEPPTEPPIATDEPPTEFPVVP